MKIGFIGCGNMGGAILQGILQGGTPAADIYVADHNLETLRQKLEAAGCTNLIHTVRGYGYKIGG